MGGQGFGTGFLRRRGETVSDRPGDGQEGIPMVLQPEEAARARSVDESGRNRQIRLAALASVVGTSIEWYDFFLYGTAAAIVFPAVFFPKSSAYAGTLESFATYAVGFAARPVGAAIFGHWGDRLGRKATLIITLLMMGLASALVGVRRGPAAGPEQGRPGWHAGARPGRRPDRRPGRGRLTRRSG